MYRNYLFLDLCNLNDTQIDQFILGVSFEPIQFLDDLIYDVGVVVDGEHIAEISPAVALWAPAVCHIGLQRIRPVWKFSWRIQEWLFLLDFDPFGRYFD